MIAILHKNNTVLMFIPALVSIDGSNVIGVDDSARGTIAGILVVDGYTYNDDTITNGVQTIRIGDTIIPANFIDQRGLLPVSEIDKLRQTQATQGQAIDFLLGV